MTMTIVGRYRRHTKHIERTGGPRLVQTQLAGGPGAAGVDNIGSHIGGA